MEKNMKKKLVFGFFSLFIFVFAINFVAAANPIGDWFTNWEAGEVSSNIAKYLLWALVSMLVYGVSDKFPGLKGKEFIKVPFALIVGFLSMAFITPPEVYSMMTAYSAMGFVLSTVIPFLILAFFTFDLAGKKGTPQERMTYKFLATAMWIGFSLFMVVRAITFEGDVNWLTWGIAAAAILITLSTGKIMALIAKQIHGEVVHGIKMAGEKIKAKRLGDLDEAKALAENQGT
jgi:hypothetical protein